jgi:hypothetical protein
MHALRVDHRSHCPNAEVSLLQNAKDSSWNIFGLSGAATAGDGLFQSKSGVLQV